MTAEEFAYVLTQRGFPLSEMDNWNTGMLLNWAYEQDRSRRRQNGEYVPDNYKRYQTLKSIEPEMDAKYKAGEISEEKYRSFKETINKCDSAIRR